MRILSKTETGALLETQSTGGGDFLVFEDQAARWNDLRFYRLVSP
jgi:hypothetical protein